MAFFQPSRPDGRSDKQVVYEHFAELPPDTIVTYEELEEALEVGLDGPVTRARVYRAIRAGGKVLLVRQQRCLITIRGTGYRVARANEHLPVVQKSESRAQRIYRQGLEILRQTRFDELGPVERQAHQGHLMVMAGLYQAVMSVARRQEAQEAAIQDILRRLGTSGSAA